MRIPQISLARTLPGLALLCVLLSGCVQTPAPEVAVVPADADAYALLAEGKHREAAQAFSELALRVGSPLKEEYQLHAADALQNAGDRAAARVLALNVSLSGLDQQLRARKNLILASIELDENNPAKVLEWLAADSVLPQGNRERARYYELRASAFEQLGQYMSAARERAIADNFISVNKREANRTALWLALARAPATQLTSVDTSSPSSFEGWITLALIARRLITDPAVFEQAISQWAVSFPAHPASSIVDDLKTASLVDANPPKHVALLLPIEGPFAGAATAIRDGFLAAWYQDNNRAKRPQISLLNTAERNITELYAEAIANGADFVVGPLSKQAVTELAKTAPLLVNTLALNHADKTILAADETANDETVETASVVADAEPEPRGILYQFALSPEEEAERVAERAWREGHTSAAIIAPTGNWGARVSTAFTQAWSELGGSIAEQRNYENDARDMTEPVASLLGVDRSKQRAKTLSRFLGAELEHTPRRRKDIEFIFMVASPKQARLLRPQFRFHHASRVPVYSTSRVYTGTPNASADIDVDGVQFGDMPWVLKPGGTSGTLRIIAESAWQNRFRKYIRFYAFGADAYSLLPHLGTLRAQPFIEFPGETGSLSVNAENYIRRGLTWAQFVEGVPIELEPSTLDEE